MSQRLVSWGPQVGIEKLAHFDIIRSKSNSEKYQNSHWYVNTHKRKRVTLSLCDFFAWVWYHSELLLHFKQLPTHRASFLFWHTQRKRLLWMSSWCKASHHLVTLSKTCSLRSMRYQLGTYSRVVSSPAHLHRFVLSSMQKCIKLNVL